MIYFLLTLFFGSLIGIAVMIGRKLLALQNGEILEFNEEEIFPKTLHLGELKGITIKGGKKYGYYMLVIVMRIYFRSINVLKNKSRHLKEKVKTAYLKRQAKKQNEKKEVSNFLKIMSEYKTKIGKIKEKVKEEEKIID